MLKRSLCMLSLIGCLTAVAQAAEFEFSYQTVNALGPLELQDGATTPVEISVVNNGTGTLFIGGLIFDFSNPDGGLSWDLKGPDATGFTADDGLIWQSWLNGDDFPPFPLAGSQYFATIDPPQTAFSGGGDATAFPILAGETVKVATLMVSADINDPGPTARDATLTVGVVPTVLVRGVDFGFSEPNDLGGTESVVLSIVPEPATFALLMIGGLATLRRRRKIA